MEEDRSEYYAYRSHALLKLERYEESKLDALTATQLSPEDSRGHLRLGIACFHLEQYQEALEAFKKCSQVGGLSFSPHQSSFVQII